MINLPAGLRVIDPHIHQWDPFTTPREISGPAKVVRRLPFLKPVLVALVPKRDRQFVGDPTHVINPYLPTDYRADAGGLPVEAVVHVEAGWHGADDGETQWVASLPFGAGAPDLGAVVFRADPRAADVAGTLERNLAATPLARGVRCSASHHPDPGVRKWADEGLLVQPTFLSGFAAVAERNLSFEAWVYSHQLPQVAVLAREYPEATIVLDHYATPVGLFGPRGRAAGHTDAARRDLLARWTDDIAEVAACPNVVAKHSGLGMPVLGWPDRPTYAEYRDTIAPLVSRTQELFGVDRTLWASNFPMDKPIVTLPDTVRALLEILGSDADPQRLLRDNARRVYRLGAE